MKKWETAQEFRSWLLDALAEREMRPVDLARKMRPDNPASAASAISKWIRGIRQPDPASCERMAYILGVDPDMVLALAGHREPVATTLSRDERRASIAAMVAAIDAGELERLEIIVRALYDQSIQEDAKASAGSQR